MSSYLFCSTPVHGHVSPMLALAAALVGRGHEVTMLTGSRFEERVRAAGARFVSLTGIADFDDRDVESYLPDRGRYRGLAQAQYDIQTIFVRPSAQQFRSVESLLQSQEFDAVLVDGAFAGVLPLLSGSAPRPPLLGVGVTPLTQLSTDVAPGGMALPPSATPLGRVRNRALNTLAKKVFFRDTQRVAEGIMAELGAPPLQIFAMDLSREFDRFLQLGPATLEYPRRDLSKNLEFVGVLPGVAGSTPTPDWWHRLDGSRPVVHVTQGTIDNHDFGRLIRPTIDGLAGSPVTVVVSLGGRSVDELGAVPSNVLVAPYFDYEALLPLTDVVITNGGFGGVLQALRHGIPVVVAGDTEDKPEVAARIAWAGVGVNLRTGTPSSSAIVSAVDTILESPRFANRAHEMQQAIGGYATIEIVEAQLADAIERHAAGQ